MSLRFRINLLITALTLIFLLVAGVIIVDDMRSSIHEEIEAGTKITVQLLTTAVYSSQFLPRTGPPHQLVLDYLRELGRVRANDILLYDGRGTLVYTSPPSHYKEGRAAPAWFADLVTPKLSLVTLQFHGGTLKISPDPSRSILDAWDNLQNLIIIGLAFFVLVNGVVYWFVGRWLKPVNTILGALSEMEQGKLQARLPDFALPEMSAISHTFNRMANTLEESMAENRRLALIVKQSSDAIMIHDLEGRISFWNPAAARLFGYSAEETAGMSATMLAPEGTEREVTEIIEVVRGRGFIENIETRRLAKSGETLDISLSAAPLIDPHTDEVIGEICSMRDITVSKRAAQTALELEQNRQLTQLLQGHLEEERKNLARELHDELGQYVTGIKTIAMSIANRSEQALPEIYAGAQTIVTVSGQIYDAVHGIIRRLRPVALDNLGLAETLRDAVTMFRARNPGVTVELNLSDNLEQLGEHLNINLYRIVQECLTNAARHAGANAVKIVLSRERGGDGRDAVQLAVNDNGRGMAAAPADLSGQQFGLVGMRERVQALHGEFRINSEPGKGVGIIVKLPISQESR